MWTEMRGYDTSVPGTTLTVPDISDGGWQMADGRSLSLRVSAWGKIVWRCPDYIRL